MKLNLKSIASLLISAAVFCTACNKNDSLSAVKPSTSTQIPAINVATSQIALNLEQSLSGTYGGIDLKTGINKPAFTVAGSAGHIISRFHALSNSLNSLCSFFVDSALNYDVNLGDTVKSNTTGRLNFYFNCNNDVPTGFIANDSLTTVGTAASHSFQYVVSQNYQITSLNSGNTLLTVNGNLKSDVDLTYQNSAAKATTVHAAYVLTGLTVDIAKGGDISGGSAAFSSIGSNNNGSWNYSGTIVFLGNHMADITINGKTYHANLLTGAIS